MSSGAATVIAMAGSNSSPDALAAAASGVPAAGSILSSSNVVSSISSFFDAPFYFGPLNALHAHVLAKAKPLTADPAVLFAYMTLPTIALWCLAYLVLMPNTRMLRRGVGAVVLGTMYGSWSSWRVYGPEGGVFNIASNIVFIHLALKALEWMWLKQHIVDPRLVKGTRNHMVAAMDLCMNSRLIGLGAIGLDEHAGVPNHSVKTIQRERHLPKVGPRPTSRLGSIARHAGYAAVCYLYIDSVMSLFRRVGGPLLAPGTGVIDSFSHTNRFIVLPGVLDWSPPPMTIAYTIQACVPGVIVAALQGGYHATAAVCLSTGLWEVDSWDVDMFEGPWKAQSLIDLWGKRWHQLFRHHFVICAVTTLMVLRIPNKPITLFPFTFFYSGALHAVGELTYTDQIPHPLRITGFFLFTGLGCMVEVIIKHATGHRVRGLAGRIWMWGWMFIVGRLAAGAWLDAGVGASTVLPAGGPGEVVAQFVMDHLLATVTAKA